MKCPNCGTDASGSFCSACGTPLRDAQCARCGAGLVPGARFCTSCGAAVGAGAAAGSGGGSNLPWYIAGGVLLLLVIILLVPTLTRDDSPGVQPGASQAPFGGGTAPGTPPPLSASPRENADRLFNRIMTARAQGDDATVMRFMPMAIDAHRLAEPLDNDGLYHLATIHIAGGDHASALDTAERILETAPNHLLALGAAGEAAELAGDRDAARGYYRRLLDAYDAELSRGLPEYRDHEAVLPEYRAAAQRVTG